MNIKWIDTEKKNSAVTIYNNNITLSKKAASFFEDASFVRVGIDKQSKDIVIKKVCLEDVEKDPSEQSGLVKLDMKSSYSRINSKKIVEEISKFVELDFRNSQSYKFNARWNTGYKMLVIPTQGGKENG